MFGSPPRLALIILLSVDDETQNRMSVHVAAPEDGQSCHIVRGPGWQRGLWRDGPPKSGNEAPRCRCKARRGLPCFRQTFVAAQWDFASCIPVPGNDMCDAECSLQTTTCMHACAKSASGASSSKIGATSIPISATKVLQKIGQVSIAALNPVRYC